MRKIPAWEWIKLQFTTLAGLLRKPAGIAVRVVDIIKKAVESPVVDFIVKATRTTADDKIRDVLRRIIRPIAIQLALFTETLNGSDAEAILQSLVAHIKALDKDGKAKAYTDLAAMIYKALEDGKMSVEEATAITQYVYEKLKANGKIS